MKILTKPNEMEDDYIVIAKFPNKTSFKKISETILKEFEPKFYEYCRESEHYDYKKNPEIKHSIKFKKVGDRVIVIGKAWDDVWEKALKENPIKLPDCCGEITSDARVMEEEYNLKQI